MIKIEIPNYDISVPVENIPLLPKGNGGIYLFYDHEGRLMYIGKSNKLWERVNCHVNSVTNLSDVKHNFAKVELIFEEDETNREIYETYMINHLKPALNVDKVFTYQTERYTETYNELEAKRSKDVQERMDRAMEDFDIFAV